ELSTKIHFLGKCMFSEKTNLAKERILKVMSAPNILRLGTAENIFVECQGCSAGDEDLRVEIKVMNHPTATRMLASTFVNLTKNKQFQELGQITIPAEGFNKNPTVKQYVYLKANFPKGELEKVVLVSFQSGYIFIQTDKTLYTPSSNVLYRMFVVKPNMEPIERDNQNKIEASIIIEIVTPDGITLPQGHMALESGMHSGQYSLGNIVSHGLWKVVAKFYSNPEQEYYVEFEVKEYVLPSFEVKLTPDVPFFHQDSQELTINIKATYLFGEELYGAAHVVFGVVRDGQKTSFPSSLQRVRIVNGNGAVKLKRQHITDTFQNVTDLVGKFIYVSVTVLTESGGEMVEAELRSIQIVTSPYTILFKNTPRYFKPGMSFDTVVEVLNPDGTPASGIAVKVFPGGVTGRTQANGMARVSINPHETLEQLIITAITSVPGITQASATMTAFPYKTKSKSYIHIGVDAEDIKLGDNLKLTLFLSKPENGKFYVTYLIFSRGQLMRYGQYERAPMIAITLSVGKDMLPSFRIIAYYYTVDNEVVSDSVWVKVRDSCMGSLKVAPSTPYPSYSPGSMFSLQVTGDPGAKVGLVAVDKAVYVLNNKQSLTLKKVWDTVNKYDPGCTPGGGKDGMNVFHDAGLLFLSSVSSESFYRQELKCPNPTRRKRASTILDVKTSLVSHYKEKQQRDCCLDGMKDTPLSYNCERRSEYIMDGAACVEAFLYCCKELENQRAERKEDSLLLARSEEDDDSYVDNSNIVTRTNFPESWLWTTIDLPACSQQSCTTTQKEVKTSLKDSITTWQFIAISLSRTHGICIADPLEVIVRKSFFIDLKLPYSAVRGEQLEIKAILHNYNPQPVTVRVDFIENLQVCSAASRRKKFRQEVRVGNQTTRSVPFIIIPMKEGELPIEVKAAVKSPESHDGIRKKLRVVPPGILTKSLQTVILDPAKKGIDGKQEEIMNSAIAMKNVIPNTPTYTQISVTGREQLSDLVENAISGKSMGTLIQQPSGCGEQNMIGMTLPVIAATYLDKTNQWETVGIEKRQEALQHIRTGYKNQLGFRKSDGSFAMYPKHQSSTWLTAYVAKVFAMAENLVGIKHSVICGAVQFLIREAQQSNGMFREVGYVSSRQMIGDVQGTDSDASMTAFCLIAMQESHRVCAAHVNDLLNSISQAVTYLEIRLPSLTNPYAVAMTSYALATENKLNRQILYKFISPELNHWPVWGTNLFTLEATAYALLALVKAKTFQDAKPVVRWFNQQQKHGGGYGSTQATIMVYQAIAEYWVGANEEEYDVNVDVEFIERKITSSFNFNKQNYYTTKTSKIGSINQDVKVVARGAGEATVRMVSWYYTLPQEKESNCQKFNLSVQLIPEKLDEDERIYKLKIEVLFKDPEHSAAMSILDIGMLTGFTADINDLNLLSKGHARTISKYEMDTALSEKGSVIIYLDRVSNKRPEEIAFKVNQKLKVGIIQPAAVTVYEYYDHQHNNEIHCVKFYHPDRKSGALQRLCKNDQCICTEENCSMQKSKKINNNERTTKICETGENKLDYGKMKNFTEVLSTDIYTMRVTKVIKEGNCDVGPEGKLRTFLSYPHCRVALNLEIGKTYLIMGMATHIRADEEKQSFQYVLGENTWIEYWPTVEQCQTEEYRPTCVGMEELVDQFTIFGCLS
uniref:Complement C3-like n=1 Tax=Mastacembelus armatus TaxID=205130 RepID=A0A3Q3S7Y5_9TELE